MEIEYTLIREKIKHVYLTVKNGEVIVKAPMNYSQSKIDDIIKEKENWILKRLSKQKENRCFNLKDKNYVYVLGKKINVEYKYKEAKRASVTLDESKCVITIPKGIKLDDEAYLKLDMALYKALKPIATKYVLIAMKKYISLTGLSPEKVEIKRFKSVWGNCSSKKVIKINLNIAHYGIEQIEYVCLHEITHLKYMNHQKEFWKHVEKYMPNYKEISRELK